MGHAVTRVGLIGFGFIGSQVYERIRLQPELGLEVAYVHNRNSARLKDVAPEHVLGDLAQGASRTPDLVVEMAHPDYTRRFGEQILAQADYLPLSVTALADDALRERLLSQAKRSGTRLLIPHGALIGTENLVEWRHMWEEVEITFTKNPANIDFSESGYDPATIQDETVVYDGPVRGIARLFPRNVNTMVTCALATTGLDRCRAKLIAVPGLNVAIADIRAVGRDRAVLSMRKEQPMVGVSGTELFESQFRSILRAANAGGAMEFV
jgi:predicted dinucleotide-utilizing enzyme